MRINVQPLFIQEQRKRQRDAFIAVASWWNPRINNTGFWELNRFNYLPNGCTMGKKANKTTLIAQKVQSRKVFTLELKWWSGRHRNVRFIRNLSCDKIEMKTCWRNEGKMSISLLKLHIQSNEFSMWFTIFVLPSYKFKYYDVINFDKQWVFVW